LGNTVKEFSQEGTSFDTNVSDLIPDLYYIQINNGNEVYNKILRKN
jgi:hypothetical protein